MKLIAVRHLIAETKEGKPNMRAVTRNRLLLLVLGSCWILGVVATPSAGAAIKFDSTSVALSDLDGSLSRDAGGHPDLHFYAKFPVPTELAHEINLALPPGFIGNPTTVGNCTVQEFFSVFHSGAADCPVQSQIGTVKGITSRETGAGEEFWEPLYNLTPGPNSPARFAFNYLNAVAYVEPSVRPTDYGITSGSTNINQTETLKEVEITIWGVPQDPSHDKERNPKGQPRIGLYTESTDAPPKPFLRNPTSCSETPVSFVAEADSWENIGLFDIVPLTADPSGAEFAFEGCEHLPFAPTLSASPTSSSADSPTGLRVDLAVPQNEAPYGQATSDVRKVVTTLPQGMSVSDSSAAGLGACSQSQIGIGTNAAPTCPDSSKIGTVEVDTPLLEEELEGVVYLAKQGENPFGSLLALYMAIEGPGFFLKLPGRVDANPSTGQLTASFDNTPQLPFQHLRLELNSGPRAPLSTPRACGTYAVKSEIVPWSGTAPVMGQSTFQITEGCPSGQFSPGLKAGTADPKAASFSPFTLRVTRVDGEPNLSQIAATLPEGLLAKLSGVPLCGNSEAATGGCPASSQVGTVTVGAGSGPSPLYVPEAGKAPTAAYLAGPYEGAPYSLVVKVPAQAGPFDLGTVTVRSGIYVDPTTTQVSVKSDPLPQILGGIPITYRDVRVEINRSNFTLNPTNCSQMKVTSVLTAAGGKTASPSAPFAASGCGELGFKPSLALQFKGQTKRAGNPALSAVLKAPAGQANIAKNTVILPKGVFIDNRHINNPCTRVQFNANACPAKSILGTATAYTPLLEKPLTGPVYFRSNGGERKLPDLVADLGGQIHVTLVGFIDSVKAGKESSRVRTRFQEVPDAPVSKFELNLYGGKRGLLQSSTNICKDLGKATVQMTGQNGKPNNFETAIKTSCGAKGKKKGAGKKK